MLLSTWPGTGSSGSNCSIRPLTATNTPCSFASDSAGCAPADRDHILGWIEAGPDLQRFIASHESWFGRPPSAEEIEVFADHYRLERLWPISGDLPEAWRHASPHLPPVTESRTCRNS